MYIYFFNIHKKHFKNLRKTEELQQKAHGFVKSLGQLADQPVFNAFASIELGSNPTQSKNIIFSPYALTKLLVSQAHSNFREFEDEAELTKKEP